MQAVATAGAGFLLAVLWFDLMFDVQVLRRQPGAVDSIATYYRRVTTDARPMNRLVALVMLVTIVATAVEAVRGTDPTWRGWAALAFIVVPVGVAASRTVPNAVRLGSRRADARTQTRLAVLIAWQHLFCLACVVVLLALQLTA